MRLTRISVENFRNIGLAHLELEGDSQFLLGANAQGKTNLLEAAAFFSALRSFRTADNRALIAQGHKQARLLCRCEHEQLGETEVIVTLEPGGKSIVQDGEKVTRLGDFLGLLPAVALSSEDIQLLRGAPALRRRLLDLVLSSADACYFTALRRYHRALGERNGALKAFAKATGSLRAAQEPVLTSFEKVMATEAAHLARARTEGLAALAAELDAAYCQISPAPESPSLRYAANCEAAATPEAFVALLTKNRERDALLGSTQRGPHRDDFDLLLQGRPAREYASEGQQRGLVLALRFAQAAFLERARSIRPVLLADDIIGELDPVRREGFWRALGAERQVIATGTATPPTDTGRNWQVFTVRGGAFSPAGAASGNSDTNAAAAAEPGH